MFNTYHGKGGAPYINIWDCQATICRDHKKDGFIRTEYCLNSDELEEAILDEIDAQGGAITQSGRMSCSEELSLQAIWEKQE